MKHTFYACGGKVDPTRLDKIRVRMMGKSGNPQKCNQTLTNKHTGSFKQGWSGG